MTNKKIETDESTLKDITGGVDYNNKDENIPTDSGSYKLGTDVKLNNDWNPSISFDNNTIDINNDITGGIIFNSGSKHNNK